MGSKACEELTGVANVKETRLEVGPSSSRADSAPHHKVSRRTSIIETETSLTVPSKANSVGTPSDVPKPAEKSAPGADEGVVSRGKVHGMALRPRRGLNVKESSGN